MSGDSKITTVTMRRVDCDTCGRAFLVPSEDVAAWTHAIEHAAPRSWSLTPEPPDDVTVLADCDGRLWDRISIGSNGWVARDGYVSDWVTWGRLLTERGPLTAVDASPKGDTQ